MNTEATYDLQECISQCRQCHDGCVQTLNYCLTQGGRHAQPAHIRLLFDCIDICETSVAFMLRDSDLHHATCAACAEVCEWCAADCEKMADDERMRACAEICRACAGICREMATAHNGAASGMEHLTEPQHEEIASLAERLYENEGRPAGREMERWLRAERILRRRCEARGRGENSLMKVRQVMTENVDVVHPEASVRTAAEAMRSHNIGALPVCDGDRLVGMITDRDITIRGVAMGREPHELKVGEVMTPGIVFCFEDQEVHEAAEVMQENQIRRLPVLNADKRLIGIVSLGDFATRTTSGEQCHVAVTLETISLH